MASGALDPRGAIEPRSNWLSLAWCSPRSMEPSAVSRLGPMLPGNRHLRRHTFVSEPDAEVLVERPLHCERALQLDDALAAHPGRGVAVKRFGHRDVCIKLRGAGLPSRGLRVVPGLRRLPWAWSPKKSVLHKTISAIRAETWEAIKRTLLASARRAKIEGGSVVRLDSTVTAALMHSPSDSSLLWDAVRVMVRLLKQAEAWMGEVARAWCDHRRAAKKRWQAIAFTRGRPKRVLLYRELIKIARTALAYLRKAAARLSGSTNPARHEPRGCASSRLAGRGPGGRHRAGAGDQGPDQPRGRVCRHEPHP